MQIQDLIQVLHGLYERQARLTRTMPYLNEAALKVARANMREVKAALSLHLDLLRAKLAEDV